MNNFFELFAKNMRSILALTIVILSFTFLFILCYHTIPIGNTTIINVAAGLILAGFGGIIGYYYGSSKDTSDKSKAEVEQASAASITTTIDKEKDKPTPENV